ncbi:MAG: damage-inducible protein CinA [Rhodobacterales bacterium CG2_30_65_12]|nr:MAG: damage-inducible protein CinA [Rhodobacterales bacterium CG2_30_65_12]
MSFAPDPAQVLALCRAKGLMVASAESCTGGMVGAALTDIAGSSDVYERGVITYSNAAKIALLGVRPETLAAHGAVSQEVAREMAEGLLASAPVDIAVSITGIAGPGGSEHKPEGRVCFGLATRSGCQTQTEEFGARGRAKVRTAARDHALALIARAASRA